MPSSRFAPLYAAVELGSDSFRLHVASWEGRAMVVAHTLNEPVRLGAGIGLDGCLDGQTVRRALDCLRRFRQALALWEVRAVRIAALSNQPLRAAQMAGGLALLLALVEELRIDELVPVGAGLRAGVIRALHRRARQDAPFPECA